MDIDQRIQLITRDVAEIINLENLVRVIKERVPMLYWGTAPTGKIHIGYLMQMLKIVDYINAGCKVKILIADLHGILDSNTSPDKVNHRATYYEHVIKAMLVHGLNCNIDNVEFIRGTSFQLSPQFTMDMYRVSALTSVKRATHAGSQVVKQTDSPNMASLLYPTLQALDEVYLDVDISVGGKDQRKIMMFSKETMPLIGYKKERTHIMTSIMGGIRVSPNIVDDEITSKMSASNESSKIDILDSFAQIKKKVNAAFCLEGNIGDNSLMDITDKLIFKLLNGRPFVVNRKEEYGGDKEFTNIQQLRDDFESKALHPADFKKSLSIILNQFLEPIRTALNTPEFKLVIKSAY